MNFIYYVARVRRSTICSWAAALLTLALPAWAEEAVEPAPFKSPFEVPDFNKGGFVLSLEYSPWASWSFDRQLLESQVGPVGDIFIQQAQSQHTATLKMAYTILGHASIGVDFTATGWNIPNPDRGGGGFLVGTVGWHPLQLVWMHQDKRPLGVDLKVYFGAGYGIAGQSTGMDGLVTELGFDAIFFFSRFFGLGLYGRMMFLQWDKFYLDFNNRVFMDLPKGPGGTFASFGFAMHFRAGD